MDEDDEESRAGIQSLIIEAMCRTDQKFIKYRLKINLFGVVTNFTSESKEEL
jgi:hypothetical protein